MKKALALILALALCAGLALPALAEESEKGRTQEEIVDAYLEADWLVLIERFDTQHGTVLYMKTSGIPHAGGESLVLVTPDGQEYNLLGDPVPRASAIGTKKIENLELSEDERYLWFDCSFPTREVMEPEGAVHEAATYYFESDLSTGKTVRTGFVPWFAFTDVPREAYFFEPVSWAQAEGITTGKTETEFAPDEPVTRAQAMEFLWRASGHPAIEAPENPFIDVAAPEWEYYLYAILWAVERGVTDGRTDTGFDPGAPVTYAEMLTFIARAAGAAVTGDDWQLAAAKWAVENNLLEGMPAAPAYSEACPRGDVICFLWRIYG